MLDVSTPNTPVLYTSSGIDITQDIVALYDKTSVNGGPATAPAACEALARRHQVSATSKLSPRSSLSVAGDYSSHWLAR